MTITQWLFLAILWGAAMLAVLGLDAYLERRRERAEQRWAWDTHVASAMELTSRRNHPTVDVFYCGNPDCGVCRSFGRGPHAA
jgi:hypothetical protein